MPNELLKSFVVTRKKVGRMLSNLLVDSHLSNVSFELRTGAILCRCRIYTGLGKPVEQSVFIEPLNVFDDQHVQENLENHLETLKIKKQQENVHLSVASARR